MCAKQHEILCVDVLTHDKDSEKSAIRNAFSFFDKRNEHFLWNAIPEMSIENDEIYKRMESKQDERQTT